jgi:3-phenylpropionate/trans-cinnamate dioxygenase ferredoxin reductase subunit
MRNAVVVGASAAGLAAADGLRDGGWDGTVTVLSAEPHPPYDRPRLSKSMLTSAEALAPLALRTPERLAEKQIEIRLGEGATGLDPDRRLVVTGDGATLPYDVLVIATGSAARSVVTSSGERLPVLRDLDDLGRFRELAVPGRRVTVVGTGLVGLEVAAALAERSIPVTVFGSEPTPLASAMGERIGAWLAAVHRSHGVRLHTGATVVAVDGMPGDYQVELADGTRHAADVVLAAVGTDPAVGWLQTSGVRLAGGVICDEAGRTSAPGVWAAGEVACFAVPGGRTPRRLEHWIDAVEQGRRVGINAARSTTAPVSGRPSFWTEQHGHTLRVVGRRAAGDDDVLVEGDIDDGRFVVVHGRDRTAHAVTACGMDRALRGYRRLLSRDAPLTEFVGHANATSGREP